MGVVVVRSEPAATELVTRLGALGVYGVTLPLLTFTEGREIHQLKEMLLQLHEGDLIICVSPQALNQLKQSNTWHPKEFKTLFHKGIRYFAVGQKTALLFQELISQAVAYPKDTEDSEHLLSLPEFSELNGKRVLILRGDSGREFLAEQCQTRGAFVRYCELYQRQWITYDWSLLCEHWSHSGITSVLISSEQQLKHLMGSIPDDYRAWFLHLKLFVINQRMKQCAMRLGVDKSDLHVLNTTNNEKIVKEIVKLL